MGYRVDALHPWASRWPLSIDLVASGLVPKFFKKLVVLHLGQNDLFKIGLTRMDYSTSTCYVEFIF